MTTRKKSYTKIALALSICLFVLWAREENGNPSGPAGPAPFAQGSLGCGL